MKASRSGGRATAPNTALPFPAASSKETLNCLSSARRPGLVTLTRRDPWTFSIQPKSIKRSAITAPRAPPRCIFRSLQSRHGYASPRLLDLNASKLTPKDDNHVSPAEVGENPLSSAFLRRKASRKERPCQPGAQLAGERVVAVPSDADGRLGLLRSLRVRR